MNSKKPLHIAVKIFNLVLLAAALVGCVYVVLMTGVDPDRKIFAGLAFLAVVSAFVYLIAGGKKADAVFFKTFAIAFAVSEFVTAAGMMIDNVAPVYIVLNGISVILALIIAAKNDLGKVNSFVFCGIIFAVKALGVVRTAPNAFSGEEMDLYIAIRTCTQLFMASALGISTYFKYLDKASRGSK